MPAAYHPPAGKHVILGAAEQKVYLTANPGASNRVAVVLFDQCICLCIVKAAHSQAWKKKARECAEDELESLTYSSVLYKTPVTLLVFD
jgi:hypothetical protein